MVILSVIIKGCVLKLESYNGKPINGYSTQGNLHEHTHTHSGKISQGNNSYCIHCERHSLE